MRVVEFYKEHIMAVNIGIVLGIIIVIIGGCLLVPNLFYDQWIWKYFWGPIVSDAQSAPAYHNGVLAAEKFTIVSELTYGLLVIIVLYALYELLKKWKISVDWGFCIAVFPYVLIGSIGRVLEDAEFYQEPFVYWFITPLIYVQLLICAIVFLLIGYYLQQRLKKRNINVITVMFTGGIILLLPFLYFTVQWLMGNQWSSGHGVRCDVFILVIGLVSLITLLMYVIARFFRRYDYIKPYSNPLNLSMVFGHLLDGIVSYVSIYDPLNMGLLAYSEKHPASDFLMQLWPPLFPIVKFLLIVLVVYVFDILYKEELKDQRCLVNLLKIGIFILGFAPGLRDILRVTMGV